MLSSFMTEPDMAALKLNGQIYSNMVGTLSVDLSIDKDNAASLARTILGKMPTTTFTDQMKPDQKMSSASSGDDDRSMTPLTFIVKFPGKLVRTDGIEDPVSGQVYWSMFAAATQFGDVTIHLVVDPGAP